MISQRLGVTLAAPAKGRPYTDFNTADGVEVLNTQEFTGIAFHVEPSSNAAAAAGNEPSLLIRATDLELIVHDGVTWQAGRDSEGEQRRYRGPVTAFVINGGAASPVAELIFLQNGEDFASEPQHVTTTPSGGAAAVAEEVEGINANNGAFTNPVPIGGINSAGNILAPCVTGDNSSVNAFPGTAGLMISMALRDDGSNITGGRVSAQFKRGGGLGTGKAVGSTLYTMEAGPTACDGYVSGSVGSGAAIDSGILGTRGVQGIGLTVDNSVGIVTRTLQIGWYAEDGITARRTINIVVAAGAVQDVAIGFGAVSPGGAANSVLGYPIAPYMRFQLAANGALAAGITSWYR